MSPDARLVALETSGAVGSVALAVGGRTVGRHFLTEPREHDARLMPALAAVLADAGLEAAAIDGVVIGAGPGSFTGVRVAAAAGKGLAHALGVPLWAISSLEAAAVSHRVLPAGTGPWPAERWRTFEPPPALEVQFDARGRRLFRAVYAWSGDTLTVERPPTFATLDEVLDDPAVEAVAVAGSGALRHRAELEGAGRQVLDAPAGVATADGLLARLWSAATAPLSDAWAWEPEYLRETGAERARRSPPDPGAA